jgi:hypothetical protein
MYPERPTATPCSYYMRTGRCNFGMTCKFHHPPGVRTVTQGEDKALYNAAWRGDMAGVISALHSGADKDWANPDEGVSGSSVLYDLCAL